MVFSISTSTVLSGIRRIQSVNGALSLPLPFSARIAGMNGADFLCMVSPSEHLALPSVEDIREGTRVSKLAAHVGDTIRPGINWFKTGEEEMAYARRDLDWKKQFSLAMFGEHARKIHERDGETETCSMCGDLCAVKIVRESLNKDS